jgi:hypothetical protein
MGGNGGVGGKGGGLGGKGGGVGLGAGFSGVTFLGKIYFMRSIILDR